MAKITLFGSVHYGSDDGKQMMMPVCFSKEELNQAFNEGFPRALCIDLDKMRMRWVEFRHEAHEFYGA